MYKHNKHDNLESFVLGTFVGATVAGLTALLLAPKSGKDMRGDIAGQADKTKQQAKEYMSIAKDKGSELKGTVEKAGSEYLENASATYEQLTNQVGSDGDTEENLDKIKQEAKDTAEGMKEALKDGFERDKEITKDAAEDAKESVDKGVDEGKTLSETDHSLPKGFPRTMNKDTNKQY
ncbi:MAG: YtxH domain-containing protein [Alkalibacterium sp.]|nr:YtxH domain-containing protein [Alkalibacterium sp.]